MGEKRVLIVVSGTRGRGNPATLTDEQALRVRSALWATVGPDIKRAILMHGACPTGVDAECARAWGDYPVLPMPAQWDTYGRIAGPRRNRAMVVAAEQFAICGWDVRALAFPLGPSPGTRDFIFEARKAALIKLEVVEL